MRSAAVHHPELTAIVKITSGVPEFLTQLFCESRPVAGRDCEVPGSGSETFLRLLSSVKSWVIVAKPASSPLFVHNSSHGSSDAMVMPHFSSGKERQDLHVI